MKYQPCVWALSAAAIGLCYLDCSEAQAFPPRIFTGPGMYYSPPGPFIAPAPVMPSMNYYTWQYAPMVPAYNPYLAPYPTYGILPPPFMTESYGRLTDPRSANPYGAHKTAEDYGYQRDAIDPAPRKRGSLYPAVPFEGAKAEETTVDTRRARFEIIVPHPDAIVLMDGVPTRQAGIQRTYVTPPLLSDRLYSSTIEVQFTDESGAKRSREKRFDFIAGETVRHTFRE